MQLVAVLLRLSVITHARGGRRTILVAMPPAVRRGGAASDAQGACRRRERAVAMRGRDRHAGSEIGVQGPASCGGAGAGLAALACGSWPDGGSHADDLQLRWIFARGAVGPASSGVRPVCR